MALVTLKDRRLIAPAALVVAIGLSLVAVVGARESLRPGATTQADEAAEAGIEWAYRTVAGAPGWDALLATAKRDGVSLVTGDRRFSVVLRNDTEAADRTLTGVGADIGGPTNDTNGYLILESTGMAGSARKTTYAVVRRTLLPPIVAALSLPGNEAHMSFAGDAWTIDGHDTNMDGSGGACTPQLGIAVGTASAERSIEAAVSADQRHNVRGRTAMSGGSGSGAIASDPALTPSTVAAFVREVGRIANVKAASTSGAAVTYTDVGASCAADWNHSSCWGTPDRPKIVYVKGEPDAMSGVAALELNGSTTGYGILVVEDGDLRVTGSLDWNGLVIVTGQWIGVGLLGAPNTQTIHGALIANETASGPGLYEGVTIQSNAAIRYSCQALDLARSAPRLTTILRAPGRSS